MFESYGVRITMSVKDAPEKLQPFLFHRIDIDPWNDSTKEAEATCPLCDKSKHLHINLQTGQFHCKRCSALTGNIYGFLQWLSEQSRATTSKEDYETLAHERKVPVLQLKNWHVSKSVVDGTWIVPAYNKDKKLSNLYRYVRLKDSDKRRLLSTPTCSHHLFGLHKFHISYKTTFIQEGPWDAMGWEALIEKLKVPKTNVLAAPGCNVFKDQWANLFPGHAIYIGFDNDHPAGPQKQIAGWAGTEHIVRLLARAKHPPESIRVLRWDVNGYDPKLPSGYDVRDFLNS